MFDKKVLAFIEKNNLLCKGETIVIGVSGSVDSLTLLYLMEKYSKQMEWKLIVAHVDHMFRGQDSYEDYKFVEQCCAELGIDFVGIQINMPDEIAKSGKNGHQLSRENRYKFFESVMKKYRAQKLAVAHHLDDQMETILMNLTRDVSSPSKIGMPVSRKLGDGHVVRPFLCVSKAEIEQRCQKFGLNPRMDSSNEKLIYSRNRFRHQVVPFIKEENPNALNHFSSFYNSVKEDDLLLQEMAIKKFQKIKITDDHGMYSLPLNDIILLKKPLQRRVLPLILNSLASLKPFSFSNVHIGLILTLIENSHPSGTIQIDEHFYVKKSFERLIFCFETYYFPDYEESLVIPGVTILPNGDRILAEQVTGMDSTNRLDECYIPEGFPLLKVRNKRDGDKIAVSQINGRKKLKKVFLEQKVPVYLRGAWPVLVSQGGKEEVLWVPNLMKSTLLNGTKQGNLFIKLTFISSTFLGRENNGNS